MTYGDHKGLPYATAGSLHSLTGVNGTSASLSRRHLSLP
jgi:hypothetical protein